ncbi:MAG: PssE/Cps14G family polysaccharide biosynthesis glycosyltransferase [Candidatus Thorarchaeota archaeon]|jgi:beta-1,4-N-acetylglucosaminyltransferase
MIFITVGTAMFDPIVKVMDKLIGDGIIKEPVVAQIGRGQYEPRNMRYFRFINSLSKAYDAADVIVSTGGAGTTLECATRGKRLVVVENTTLMEGHQAQLIGEMARRGHLIWCRDPDTLEDCIQKARSKTFTPFVSDKPRAHEFILKLIDESQ